MTITILSPYQIFFIDEAEKLSAVLKDARVRPIKQVPSFACFSGKKQFITGVEFDGEKTDFLKVSFGFASDIPQKMFSWFGYFYYPCVLEGKHMQLAAVKADLLNCAGTGDLILFQKARTKYHPIVQLAAKIAPPIWNAATGELYYITAKGALARIHGEKGEILAPHAEFFCLNNTGSEVAYYDGECLVRVALDTGITRKIPAMDVTAMGYGAEDERLFFAVSKEEVHSLYSVHKTSAEVSLVIKTSARITALGAL